MAKVEIFTGPGCAHCRQAKTLLDEREIDHVEYDIAIPEHRAEFVKRLPRVRSIPQIFINGEHVGNEEDLSLIAGDGRLEQMLANH